MRDGSDLLKTYEYMISKAFNHQDKHNLDRITQFVFGASLAGSKRKLFVTVNKKKTVRDFFESTNP